MTASSQQKPRGYSTICLPIDQDRYQQIIDRIEKANLAARPAPHVAPPPAKAETPPLPAPAETPEIVLDLLTDPEEELEEVELVAEEEEWVKLVSHYSIDNVSHTLARAEDREEIAGILIDYLGQEFERVALFVIRNDAAYGWKGVTRGEEFTEFEKAVIPLAGPSVLKTVSEAVGYYLGTIPDTPPNALMRDAMGGGRPNAALLLPLVIAGRVVTILYLEGGESALGDRFIELHRLLAKAVLAFEILIFREKILML